jgi:hypothetical protein
MRSARCSVLALALTAACSNKPFHPTACNGAAELCDRRYDQAVYPTTHNAFSTVAGNFGAPNQTYDMPRQLADGIRGMMLDVHPYEDENDNPSVFLCHGPCIIGRQPLVEGLTQLRQFLEKNRSETLGLILENYVPADALNDAFNASGLARLVLPRAAGEPWPTLREMIERDQRVVVLTDKGGGAYPWLLDEFATAWENPYQNATIDDFRCSVNRGQVTNDLFILNHFIESTVPLKSNAELANVEPGFLTHAQSCRTESGRLPNFVTVDYYEVGDLFGVVRDLNGL